MRKVIVPFLVVLMIFVSCKKEAAQAPNGLIEKDKMVDIIYDITLLEAARNQAPLVLDSFKDNSEQYIYKKYKIDSIQFAQSNIYYATDLKEYNKMYDLVKLRLEKAKNQTDAMLQLEKKKIYLAKKNKKGLKVVKEIDSVKK